MNFFKSKITKEEVNALPLDAFKGNIHIIDNRKQLKTIIPKLKKHKILGFDTETRPVFQKNVFRKVALLQLATDKEAYLFRLNKIGLSGELAALLSDPNIIKTGVALHDDLKELRMRREFEPYGFVELQTYVSKFGIEDAGLRKLAANILGFRISKAEQLSNWERTILNTKQKIYAATDAWVGYLIYSRLQDSLEKDGKANQ